MKLYLISFSLILTTYFASAQELKKTIAAKRTSSPPKIDGIIDEEIWKNAPLATNFTAFQPVPDVKEDEKHKTEVYILYDDQAIYIAARMREVDEKDIAKELTNRDQIGNSDFINVILDTYNDKINAQ